MKYKKKMFKNKCQPCEAGIRNIVIYSFAFSISRLGVFGVFLRNFVHCNEK